MSIDVLLSRLRRVRNTGRGRWIASCPTREDKHPSLAIRELPDGRILVHDFGGSAVHEVLDAVGLTFSDLYPPKEPVHGKPERRPFSAADILRCLVNEVLIVAISGSRLLKGETFNETDQERLMTAVGRILAAVEEDLG